MKTQEATNRQKVTIQTIGIKWNGWAIQGDEKDTKSAKQHREARKEAPNL